MGALRGSHSAQRGGTTSGLGAARPPWIAFSARIRGWRRPDDSHTETPLHWAASSDDVAVLDVLLDAGANIDAPGAVLGGGGPLADACGFGNWACATRLVERGARTRLKDEAALGMLDRVEAAFLDPVRAPTAEEITQALWSACHGGAYACAEYLLQRGADLNWIGWDGMTPLDVAERDAPTVLVDWLRTNGGRRAEELT